MVSMNNNAVGLIEAVFCCDFSSIYFTKYNYNVTGCSLENVTYEKKILEWEQ